MGRGHYAVGLTLAYTQRTAYALRPHTPPKLCLKILFFKYSVGWCTVHMQYVLTIVDYGVCSTHSHAPVALIIYYQDSISLRMYFWKQYEFSFIFIFNRNLRIYFKSKKSYPYDYKYWNYVTRCYYLNIN